jgi:hypothetical protein
MAQPVTSAYVQPSLLTEGLPRQWLQFQDQAQQARLKSPRDNHVQPAPPSPSPLSSSPQQHKATNGPAPWWPASTTAINRFSLASSPSASRSTGVTTPVASVPLVQPWETPGTLQPATNASASGASSLHHFLSSAGAIGPEPLADPTCPWFWPHLTTEEARHILKSLPGEPGLFLFFLVHGRPGDALGGHPAGGEQPRAPTLAMATLDDALEPKLVCLDVRCELVGADNFDPVVLNAVLQKLQDQQRVPSLPPLRAFVAGTLSRPRRVGLPQ